MRLETYYATSWDEAQQKARVLADMGAWGIMIKYWEEKWEISGYLD